MGSPLRALLRLAGYLGWTGLLVPVQALGLAFGFGYAKRLPAMYHRVACRILGLDIEILGEICTRPPVLFISNHASYLDIPVLGSLVPGSFVAKAEVAGWPMFGLLAKLQRTVFVDRRIATAIDQRDEIANRLSGGENLILFPEGTSGDGNRLLPFKSALFGAAFAGVGDGPITVQPVSVAYTKLDGMPLGRSLRPFFAWYGAMDMMPHVWRMLGLGQLGVTVRFHAPITTADHASRKALSEYCYGTIRRGLAHSLAGRPTSEVTAAPAAAALL